MWKLSRTTTTIAAADTDAATTAITDAVHVTGVNAATTTTYGGN